MCSTRSFTPHTSVCFGPTAHVLQSLDREWLDLFNRLLVKHFSVTDCHAVYGRIVNTLCRVVAWGTLGHCLVATLNEQASG